MKVRQFKLQVFIVACILFVAPTPFAQSPQGLIPPQMAAQRQKQMEKAQKEFLKNLKKQNPKAYREAVKQMARQKKIDSIIKKYKDGDLSHAEAQKALGSLLKEDLQRQVDSIPDEIKALDRQKKMLDQQIQVLKKAQVNPEVFIQNQIDQMLGVNLDSESPN